MIESGARGAWSEIEERLRPYVARRAASASDADDILQEVFVRVHRSIGGLRDSENLGGWIYRIAKNVLADFARAGARHSTSTLVDQPEVAEADSSEEVDELQADLGECIALFVARLPSPYREAVTLTELQGLTQKEAADLLGVSLPAIKSRVQRGRDKIRAMFAECCEISVDGRGRVIACEPRSLDDVPDDCRDAAVAWASRKSRRAP